MSGMTEIQCTRFPDLNAHRRDKNQKATSSKRLLGLNATKEGLILAWGHLLSAYTGEDEEVFFYSDDGIIRMDILNGTAFSVHEGDALSSQAGGTGVFLRTSWEPKELALQITYNPAEDVGELISHGYVPQLHLEQLELQLRSAIGKALSGLNSNHVWDVNTDMALSVINERPSSLPGPQLLHDLISWHAHCDKSAIEFRNNEDHIVKVSYTTLHGRSQQLASKICSKFSTSEPCSQPVIPLLIPQSAELYIAMLAVLQSGSAFCPLNLDMPPDRLRFVLQDVSASVVLTTVAFQDRVADITGLACLIIDDSSSTTLDEKPQLGSFKLFTVRPKDTAYVMYTSGSTGQPKGVSVSHTSATQSLLAHDEHIPHYSRFLQFAAPTFDVSLFEIFFTLFRGSTLIGCSRAELLRDLPAIIRRLNVDAAELTPTVAGGLLQRRENAPPLKLLLTIGEMLTQSVVEEFGGDETHESMLWAMYGPTEATIHCTLRPAFSRRFKVGNIGIPLSTVSAFVIAPEFEDSNDPGDISILPLGFVGELAVGGFQLADGYLNRPEQTAKAFVESKKYRRLYRTGDKARMLSDGSIECLGRISSGQIKLRGQRIELGEVQYAVTRCEGCRDAVASVILGTLVVFCLAESGVTTNDVLASCRQWLPEFMVPRDVVMLSEYPYLPSGKVDRKALENTYKSAMEGIPNTEEDPISLEVQQICSVLEKVLGHPVNPNGSLSLLGIDSLWAIKASSALRLSGFLVTPLDLLSSFSVNHLCQLKSSAGQLALTGQKLQKDEAVEEDMLTEIRSLAYDIPALKRFESDIVQITDCTPLQVSMLAETTKDPTAYCNRVMIQLPHGASFMDIKGWLQALAKGNEILRSGFCQLPSPRFPFAFVIWKEISEDQILEVSMFDDIFPLKHENDFIRPLKFQVHIEQQSTTLLIQIHHSLYDGWSLDLVLKDLDALIQGKVPEERPQFGRVIEYYRNLDIRASSEYWQEHMHNYRPIPMANYNGRVIESAEIECQTFGFRTDYGKLRSEARMQGISPQTFFQAALAYVLSCYIGVQDIAIGTVTSGRTIPIADIEEVMGPCVTTLPLRVDVSRSRRVSDLLKDVHSLNRCMLQYSEEPLRSIKRACGLSTTEQLWDVLFVWQETIETRNQAEYSVKLLGSSDRLECAVTIEIEPRGDSISAKATYHSAVLPRAQVLLLLEQVDHLVEQFALSPSALLEGIEAILPSNVLAITNPVPKIPIFEYGLAQTVERHALTSPNKHAILFSSSIDTGGASAETLTYGELNEKANRLARLLLSHLQENVELIGVCLEKSLDLYVSILAVLKTGRGYLPITPSTPPERIKIVLKEASVGLCLSQTSISSGIGLRNQCEVVDVDSANLSEFPLNNVGIGHQGLQISYAVFTSGSTGTPKGVLVTQQNLLSNLKVLSEIYPVSNDDKLLQACSQAFDVSVFEIFFAWYTGICLCSAANDVLYQDLETSIQQMGITHLSLTPTVAALVNPNNVPNVKFLVTAGEAVTEKVMKAWADRGLFQGYGPSETTNICTVKPNVTSRDLVNNIGPPLRNTSAFVIKTTSNDVLPSGALGELCFGGDQVFRGYLNNSELTKTKIIVHPKYGRLYRSGDMGRLLHDGSILFAGRTDDQVKIRGQRVELGEINYAVLQNQNVLDCVTIVTNEQQTKAARLLTFWVPCYQHRSTFSIAALSDRTVAIANSMLQDLAATLPSYMIPSALIPITMIPVTSQGKVDKKALVAKFQGLDNELLNLLAKVDDTLHDSIDWTDSERLIAQAVAHVLGLRIDEVKRHLSFFSLGLDSISAISLSKMLRNLDQPQAMVSTILQNPTVARLAQNLQSSPVTETTNSVNLTHVFNQSTLQSIQKKIGNAGIEASAILPCTPLQEAMLSSAYSSSSAAYYNTMLFRIHGDVQKMQDCWNLMVRRHDILRTCFVTTDEPAYPFAQIVLSKHMVQWGSGEISNRNSMRDYAHDAVGANAGYVVDSCEPPYLLNIIQCEGSAYLQFSCHHALHDGTANAIMLNEVEQLLREEPLPEPASFERFLQEVVKNKSPKAIDYWTNRLRGYQPTLLVSKGHKHDVSSLKLQGLLNNLETKCHGIGVSLLILAQTAWAKTLQSLFGESDICFGNIVSGRTLPIDGLDRLVAPTFNTIPVRTNVNGNRSNIELLEEMKHSNIDSLTYQLSPLRYIQSRLGFGGFGLFSTLLLLQQSPLELNTDVWALEEEYGEMDFPVILELVPHRKTDTLLLNLHYESYLLSPGQSNEVLSVFSHAIESCAQYPTSRTTDFTGFSQETIRNIGGGLYRPKISDLSVNKTRGQLPLTAAQQEVCKILSGFAHIPMSQLCLDTTIHQIGLDSISSIRLASQLRSLKGINITAADILQKPSIRDLATSIEDKILQGSTFYAFDFAAFEERHRSRICSDLGIPIQKVESIRPCTALQMGLASQFLRSKTLYSNHITYQSNISCSLHELREAWETVANLHVMLRTGFVELDDPTFSFAMVTYPPFEHNIPVETCSSSESRAMDIKEWREHCTIRFHKEMFTPPWAVLLEEKDEKTFMHLTLFHGLYDAQSLSQILHDLMSVCIKKVHPQSDTVEPVLSKILGLSISTTSDKEVQDRTEYWKEVLGNASINAFPNMTPLYSSTGRFAVFEKRLSRQLHQLETRCIHTGVTLQAVGMAAWAQLLSAYIGEPSVTFGVVFSGRDMLVEAENAVFPCVTTVPISVAVSKRNKELVDTLMKLSANARKHQFTPLGDIQRCLGRPNEILFDTIFAYQKISRNQYSELWKVVDEVSTAEYSVSIELEPQEDDALLIRVTFLSDVLPEEQAHLLVAQFEALLINILDCPDKNLDDRLDQYTDIVSITPPKEAMLPSPARLLHEFVEINAQRLPECSAFEFATHIDGTEVTSKCWTYKELDEEGNRIANLIISRGVCSGSLVAICFDKCPDAYFSILGILKAGCAYVAIDPHAPVARKSFIIRDSCACMLLTDQTRAIEFERPNIEIPILHLDDGPQASLSRANPHLTTNIGPDSVCYCLYTSGTTGTPKGCEITHRNAVQAMRSFSRLFSGRWDENSKWLQFASFHFDVSVLEQYWSWSEGIRVVSVPRDLIFEDFSNTIRALGISHIDLTPSLAALLHPDEVPSLCKGVFIVGGEPLKQEILDAWGPMECVHNGYGPTEATIGVTMFPRVPKAGKPSNIGRQFDNVGTYVLKPDTTLPVLRGAVGELCISGALVGKGYLNRPELTEEKFPYIKEFRDRVYRTGDLVRILHDGSFLFLGRADHQVKLRGQRLEISEIDITIKRGVQEIAEVATYVMKHPKQQREQLITFLTISGQSNRSQRLEILYDRSLIPIISLAREVCLTRLPGYMVPTHFVPVAAMPLSANNKTDGRVLRTMFENMSSRQLQLLSSTVAEGEELSSAEEKVASILRKFVSVDNEVISPSSSIFELGLDSISVIRFVRGLKAANFQNATPSLVMKHGTIKALAKALTSTRIQDGKASTLATRQRIAACYHRYRLDAAKTFNVRPKDVEAIAPCTPLQEGMISESLNASDSAYFALFSCKLRKQTSVPRLHSAWASAFEGLQILRTCFLQTENGYMQVLLRGTPLPWSETAVSDEQIDKYLHKLKLDWRAKNSTHFSTPLKLAVVTSPSQIVLGIFLFHGLYDGNSLAMLLSLVRALYLEDKSNIHFGPPFYSILEHGPLNVMDQAKEFWIRQIRTERLGLLSPLERNPTPSEEVLRFSMAIKDVGKLDDLRKQLSVTHQAMIQACWAVSLRNNYNRPVSLGIVTSGRSVDFDDADRVIGPLFNTVPFQIGFDASDSWISVTQRCHKFNVAVLPFQHTPLRQIQKWCKVGPQQRMFDTLFVFQKETAETARAAENQLWTLVDNGLSADYPLSIEAELKLNGTLRITLSGQGNVNTQAVLQKLCQDFELAIFALIQSPAQLVPATTDQVSDIEIPTTSNPVGEAQGPHINGYKSFEWLDEALLLRKEIAILADVAESEIGADVSIHELGLDSIDAIKLSSRLGKLGRGIPASRIMRKPTISAMLESISAEKQEHHQKAIYNLEQHEIQLRKHFEEEGELLHNVELVLPATPLQEAMVAEMLNSSFTRYYNHDVLKLAEKVNIGKLKEAWQLVYNQSSILRTGFKPVTDPALHCSLSQIVLKPKPLDWTEMKCSSLKEISTLLDNIAQAAAQAAETSTYFRLTLVQINSEHFLVLSLPHALYDGWSIGLLHDDIQNAYAGKRVDRPSNRVVLSEIAQASTLEAQTFWSDYLSRTRPCQLPERSPLKKEMKSLVRRKEHVSGIPVKRLRSFCKAQSITMQTLGQTCWSMVLASYVGQLEVIFGVVLSGRDTEAAQQAMFPTMNTITFRSFLHGSGADMLRYTQENMANIRQFQHFPLRKALSYADTGGDKLFDSLFIYQIRPKGSQPEETLYESVDGYSDVEFPICVEMEIVDLHLVWRVACNGQAYGDEEPLDILKRLDMSLQDLLDNSSEEILSFKGGNTRISKLPAFKASQNFPSPAEKYTEKETEEKTELSPTAKKIRKVLSIISKVPEDEITAESTLFHVGLDSVSAIQVAAALRKQGISLSVSDMLRARTLDGMARFVNEQANNILQVDDTLKSCTILNAAEFSTIKLLRDSGVNDAGFHENLLEYTMPTTAGQVYMLSTWQSSGGRLFFDEFKFLVKEKVSFEHIISAWKQFVSLNSILRTVFVATGRKDSPYAQAVLKPGHSMLKESQGETRQGFLPALGYGDMFQHIIASGQPFVVLSYKRLADETWDLGLKIHHALYDGVSLLCLLRELRSLIHSHQASPSVNDTPKSSSSEAFRRFVDQSHKAKQFDQAKRFWTEYLFGASSETSAISPDMHRQRVIKYKPKLFQNTNPLLSLARRQGITLPSIFLATYARLYASLKLDSSDSDMIIGIYMANRTHDIDHLETSPTVNLLPLRVRTKIPLLESATQIHADLGRINEFQNVSVGLWEIYEWTGVKVGTFVNWLKLPGGDDGENGTGSTGEETRSANEARDEIIESDASEFEVPRELRNNIALEAYPPSIDIEVALRGGALDVGIFGPTALIDSNAAHELLDKIREGLEAFTKEG